MRCVDDLFQADLIWPRLRELKHVLEHAEMSGSSLATPWPWRSTVTARHCGKWMGMVANVGEEMESDKRVLSNLSRNMLPERDAL